MMVPAVSALIVLWSSIAVQPGVKTHSLDDCRPVPSSSDNRKVGAMSVTTKADQDAASSSASSSASSVASTRSTSTVSMSSSSRGSSSKSRAVSSYTDANGRTVTKVSEDGLCTVTVTD